MGVLGVVPGLLDRADRDDLARVHHGYALAEVTDDRQVVGDEDEREVELGDLAIFPADVARVIGLVAEGTLTDTMARQVVEGVLAGDGSPDGVVAGRGLQVVHADAPLLAAIDAAGGARAGRAPTPPRGTGAAVRAAPGSVASTGLLPGWSPPATARS